MKSYYSISEDDLGRNSKIPLKVFGSSEEVFQYLAKEMTDEIKKNNGLGEKTVIICPVGPVGHYPHFIKMVNEERISLKKCWFFNMDEYLDEDGSLVGEDHILSFKGFMKREVYGKIDHELIMPESQRLFPDPHDTGAYTDLISQLGGAGICIGGIGINGHLAFNEPQPDLTVEEFSVLKTRVLDISPETRTANAIGSLGGDIEDMPKRCVTVGMSEILGARKIRLGVFRDWHRSVVRRAAYGEVSASFPASLLQKHGDALIAVNDNASKRPF